MVFTATDDKVCDTDVGWFVGWNTVAWGVKVGAETAVCCNGWTYKVPKELLLLFVAVVELFCWENCICVGTKLVFVGCN